MKVKRLGTLKAQKDRDPVQVQLEAWAEPRQD